MLLYYITDRTKFPGDEDSRRHALLKKIGEAARCGVDFIQLREKDLPTAELEKLAKEAAQAVASNSTPTKLLVNSRTDVAMACGAHGIHLRGDDISAAEVRKIWSGRSDAVIGVSCHSVDEVAQAAVAHADFAVFAPVFEKNDASGVAPAGLEKLREACRQGIPVLALGGVTLKNAETCCEAGAAGVAGIRLFQENDLASVVKALRT